MRGLLFQGHRARPPRVENPRQPGALALILALGCGRTVSVAVTDGAVEAEVVAPAECAADEDCDDGVGCTADRCRSGRCERVAVPSRCTDGTVCDGVNGCVDPVCGVLSPCDGVDGGVRCVDLAGSTEDCGRCGVRCREGDVCDRGACVPRQRGASARCRGAADCEAPYTCDAELGGVCSLPCTPSDADTERRVCGVGATCLSLDGVEGRCLRGCDPRERVVNRGGCARAQVCTALWMSHDVARLDAPACVGFCESDGDCQGSARGGRCSLRTGVCGRRADDGRMAADGSPCDPAALDEGGRSATCRGYCARVGSTTRGLCASLFNRVSRERCWDGPETMTPLGPAGADNLALCVYRSCTDGCACAVGAVCAWPEDGRGAPVVGGSRYCLPPTSSQPTGVPCGA